MRELESEKIRRIVDELCQNIGGDWLLTGGSLVRLEFDSSRGTQDIDLVNIRHESKSHEVLLAELFGFAKTIGLSPDAVNSAAHYFVKQVPQWENQLVEIKRGPKGRIFRPTLSFFVFLKLARGSEIDSADIAAAVKSCGAREFDEALFLKWATPEICKRFEAQRGKWTL